MSQSSSFFDSVSYVCCTYIVDEMFFFLSIAPLRSCLHGGEGRHVIQAAVSSIHTSVNYTFYELNDDDNVIRAEEQLFLHILNSN